MDISKTVAFLSLLSASFTGNAINADHWGPLRDIGAYGLVGVALAMPAYKGDWHGFEQAAYSVATTSGLGLVGKSLIDEARPDHSGHDSFPSNHTANAFAAATTINLRYSDKSAWPAYGIAVLVGVGRVQANKHYWKDVFAGAVMGSLTSWVFTETFDKNVHVVPWAGQNKIGLTLSMLW